MEFKDINIDGDAVIVNTPAQELPEEPNHIVQGEEPHMQPNPGEGADLGKNLCDAFKKILKSKEIYEDDPISYLLNSVKLVISGYYFLDSKETFSDVTMTYEGSSADYVGFEGTINGNYVYLYFYFDERGLVPDSGSGFRLSKVRVEMLDNEQSPLYKYLKDVYHNTKPVKDTYRDGGHPKTEEYDVASMKTEVKPEPNLVNFLKGILIKGKKLEDYIDSEGGVTEEELQAALADYAKKSELGLEFIEWDGERNFTSAEFTKLITGKVGVKQNQRDGVGNEYYYIYLPTYIEIGGTSIELSCIDVYGENATGIELNGLLIYTDGSFELYRNSLSIFVGTKLYKHEINFSFVDSDTNLTLPMYVISTKSTPYTLDDASWFVGVEGVISITFDEYLAVSMFVPQLYYDSDADKIYDVVEGTSFDTITDFMDTVTEL